MPATRAAVRALSTTAARSTSTHARLVRPLIDTFTGARMIPGPEAKCKGDSALGRALALVRDLRQRCPWDGAQTPATLRPYLVEEVLESSIRRSAATIPATARRARRSPAAPRISDRDRRRALRSSTPRGSRTLLKRRCGGGIRTCSGAVKACLLGAGEEEEEVGRVRRSRGAAPDPASCSDGLPTCRSAPPVSDSIGRMRVGRRTKVKGGGRRGRDGQPDSGQA